MWEDLRSGVAQQHRDAQILAVNRVTPGNTMLASIHCFRVLSYMLPAGQKDVRERISPQKVGELTSGPHICCCPMRRTDLCQPTLYHPSLLLLILVRRYLRTFSSNRGNIGSVFPRGPYASECPSSLIILGQLTTVTSRPGALNRLYNGKPQSIGRPCIRVAYRCEYYAELVAPSRRS